MKHRLLIGGIRILTSAVVTGFGVVALCLAQANPPTLKSTPAVPSSSPSGQQAQTAQPDQNTPPPAPQLDPQEEAAYKAYYDAGPQGVDTRIQLGNDFLQKYPTSRYVESVYAGLVQAYYAKQDWKDFYAVADKALALNADDVGVLTVVGWVIPHSFNPSDPDTEKNLEKAERYEKRAIEVIGAMPKPANLTDDQFAASKAAALSQAHSALGLVYFRRQQPADSASELQQATQASASPDPTDFYVLGIDLNNLKRFPEAADAFSRCSQIMGSLQDRCKQDADNAKKQASQPK
jgi:tetratricopeptide (TPR) repeat protein